jgi:NTE family protein
MEESNINNIEFENEFIENNFSDNKIVKKYDTLVLSGGGIKGLAHLGALKYLFEQKIIDSIKNYVACSVGTIVSYLIIIGYKPDDLFVFFKILNIDNLKSINFENILSDYGVDNGQLLIKLLEILTLNKFGKKTFTFLELYNKTNIKFTTTSVCLNTKSIEYFNYENNPDMDVLLAIRMSIAIPFIFSPVKHNDKYYVDGGLMNNYPIDFVNENIDNIIGITIIDGNDEVCEINTFEDFIIQIIYAAIDSSSSKNIQYFKKQTIEIKLEKKFGLYSSIGMDEKEELFNFGYISSANYFNNL